jgi:hypothetical protein
MNGIEIPVITSNADILHGILSKYGFTVEIVRHS